MPNLAFVVGTGHRWRAVSGLPTARSGPPSSQDWATKPRHLHVLQFCLKFAMPLVALLGAWIEVNISLAFNNYLKELWNWRLAFAAIVVAATVRAPLYVLAAHG